MRIISQDSKFDLPYESCVIWIDDKAGINVSPIGEPDSNYTFAIYSTQEKAEKAMQLLHNIYSGMPITCDISKWEEEYEGEKLKEILETSSIDSVPNEMLKIEYVNRMVFQFPKEEDL